MALKRRISYQWQLFIPLVTTLWIVILGMAYIQYANEREYRKDTVDSQLDIVTKRIVATYETDVDPTQFVDFICRYYIENPVYDRLRVSVYKDRTADAQLGRAYQPDGQHSRGGLRQPLLPLAGRFP